MCTKGFVPHVTFSIHLIKVGSCELPLPLADQTWGRNQRTAVVGNGCQEVGWAPQSSPILYHCTPRLTTSLTKHPRCLGIQPVSHTNLQAGECWSTYWKETNEVPFINESRLQDDPWAASFLERSLMGPKQGSGWTLRLPHHGIWGLEPFPQFSGPRERATQDTCYSAYHHSLSERL